MDFLYACLFSSGQVKVGRSNDPESRIASHADRVACVGIELVEKAIEPATDRIIARESALIERCASRASERHKSEWFSGLDFASVREWLREFAQCDMPAAVLDQYPVISLETRRAIAARADMPVGQVLQALNGERPAGPAVAVRIERASDGLIRRWHLRPDDWHLIWPELIGKEGAPAIPDDAAQKAA